MRTDRMVTVHTENYPFSFLFFCLRVTTGIKCQGGGKNSLCLVLDVSVEYITFCFFGWKKKIGSFSKLMLLSLNNKISVSLASYLMRLDHKKGGKKNLP